MTARIAVFASDGVRLAADVYGPPGRPTLVVAGATGVPRRYYRRFASWLEQRDVTVVTFDYRGIGESEAPHDATMAQWGERDLAAVLRYARTSLVPSRLVVLGHSVGGQILPLAEGAETIDGAMLIASQSGYWRLWSGVDRARIWLFFHVIVPLFAHAIGRVPGRAVGGGEDLPKHVALQWARWARTPEYLLSHARDVAERFAEVRAPVRALSFTDDPIAPDASVEALLALYANADRVHRRIAPSDLGVTSIGHFGFFREQIGAPLWPRVADFVRGASAELDRSADRAHG